MTVSHMDMFLAHLDVVMTDFHKSKYLFTTTFTWAIPPSRRPRYAVTLHSDLYILTEAYDVRSFTSMLPVCLDGTVLTCRFGSVGKQNAELAIWSVFNVAESLTNH